MASIFLCHSSRDKFFVRKLADALRSAGVRAWIDEAEIRIGDSLSKKIGEALQDVDYVGVVLSTSSIESAWVQRELAAAMDRELREEKVVLPILLERVEVPVFLRDKLYADFTEDQRFQETFRKLLETLGAESPGSELPAPTEEPTQISTLTPSEKILTQFDDIQITELDAESSYKPDPSTDLYNVHVKLSRVPPYDWAAIFAAERKFPRHSMWRRAWIEGAHIIIHCVPEELELYHMRDLFTDVGNSNERYREHLTQLAQREAAERDRFDQQRESLQTLRKRLGFDK